MVLISVLVDELPSDLGNCVWVSIVYLTTIHQMPIPLSLNSRNKPIRFILLALQI